MKEKEIWKAIPEYEGYEASNLGRIRSLKSGKVKVLKSVNGPHRYYRVNLCKNGKKKEFLVHRLVYEVFNGPIPLGMTVDHINSDKLDNRLQNLQLLTRGDNARKAKKGKPLSEEAKAKISATLKGRTPWNKGKKYKPHSEEHKAKISASRKGQKLSEETKAKLSAAHKARREKSLRNK